METNYPECYGHYYKYNICQDMSCRLRGECKDDSSVKYYNKDWSRIYDKISNGIYKQS